MVGESGFVRDTEVALDDYKIPKGKVEIDTCGWQHHKARPRGAIEQSFGDTRQQIREDEKKAVQRMAT